MLVYLPRLKKYTILTILIALLLIVFTPFSSAAEELEIKQPSFTINDQQAEFSFYLTNNNYEPVTPKGKVIIKNQLGQIVWEKDFDYQSPLAAQQTDKLSFNWQANLKTMGKLKASVNLEDNGKKVEKQVFSFYVVPSLIGGLATASLVLLGGKSVLKVAKYFVA